MAKDTKIEWTHHTINLWWGCTKVHTGCDNCYAEKLSKRFGNNVWGNYNPRKEITSVWRELAKMQKQAQKNGEIHRVFIGSMMDIFEKPIPLISSAIREYHTGVLRNRLFDLISIGRYPNLLFLFLTKRPGNINKYIPENWKTTPPENVMFGTSPSNQKTANKLIPQLLKVNGKRFLSVEPQLSEISFRWALWHDYKDDSKANHEIRNGRQILIRTQYDGIQGIDWIIQGGESGPHKRPFNIAWAIKMRDQCAEAKIPYFFKQIDKIQTIPDELNIRQFPEFLQN